MIRSFLLVAILSFSYFAQPLFAQQNSFRVGTNYSFHLSSELTNGLGAELAYERYFDGPSLIGGLNLSYVINDYKMLGAMAYAKKELDFLGGSYGGAFALGGSKANGGYYALGVLGGKEFYLGDYVMLDVGARVGPAYNNIRFAGASNRRLFGLHVQPYVQLGYRF